jgi:hypothetical protein
MIISPIESDNPWFLEVSSVMENRLLPATLEEVRILVPIWLVLIAALSFAPFAIKFHLRTIGAFHYLGHSSIFFVTAVLILWNATGLVSKAWRSVSVVLFGALLELLEAISFHNVFEWRDVLSDVVGVVIAVVLVSAVKFTMTALPRSRDVSDECS